MSIMLAPGRGLFNKVSAFKTNSWSFYLPFLTKKQRKGDLFRTLQRKIVPLFRNLLLKNTASIFLSVWHEVNERHCGKTDRRKSGLLEISLPLDTLQLAHTVKSEKLLLLGGASPYVPL